MYMNVVHFSDIIWRVASGGYGHLLGLDELINVLTKGKRTIGQIVPQSTLA